MYNGGVFVEVCNIGFVDWYLNICGVCELFIKGVGVIGVRVCWCCCWDWNWWLNWLKGNDGFM